MAEKTLISLDPPKEKNMASSLNDMANKAVCVLPVSDHLNMKSPCYFRESGRLSVSFQDFGRESLGILPADFGKDALSFLNMSFSDREFCFKNILNMSDYGRPSLDSGRESLGILQVNKLDVRLGYEDDKIPEIMLTISERNEDVGNILDTAFLFPSPRKTILSSTSSQNSGFPSFNSCSLEEPSRIYSVSKNEAVSCITSNLELYSAPSELNIAKIISSSESEQMNSESCANELFPSPNKIFWSTGKAIKCKSVQRRSFYGGKLDFNEERENILHDSIVIEGNYIAQKIADGSILKNGYGTHILDSTPQPSWPSDLDESKMKEKDSPELKCEAKPKTKEEMCPEPQENADSHMKTSRVDATPKKSKDAREILQNLSEILNSSHRSDQQRSQGQNLLSSLAEILCEGSENNTSHFDDSGHSSFIEQNDSSDKDKNDQYEVLDLSKKSSDSKDSKSYEYISNISANKVAKTIIERRLSQSFCSRTPSTEQMNLTDGNKKRNSSTSGLESTKNINCNSNSSVKSNDSQDSVNCLININSKFRMKPSTGVTKKGPLRAVIPVKDMKRKSFNTAQTPDKSQQRCSTSLQSKRTSTPINEPKLKPMAASTPTTRQVKDLKDISGSNSKLPRVGFSNDKNPSKSDKSPAVKASSSKEHRTSLNSQKSSTDKINTSGSSFRTSFSKLERVPLRRNSASEIKIDDIRKLKRSNSLGKETGLMSSLGKIRANLLKSPYFDIKGKGILSEANNNNGCGIPENTKYSISTPLNLASKVKTGKGKRPLKIE